MHRCTEGFACQHLLVPLDSDPDHEQGLPVAAGLARVCRASVHLLGVVPTLSTLPGRQGTAARLLPSATSTLLDMTKDLLSCPTLGHCKRTGGVLCQEKP